MPIHAEEEMEDDEFSVFDVEEAILTGEITEKQKDKLSGENKYFIRGESIDGQAMFVAVKIGPTGKLIFITVFTG